MNINILNRYVSFLTTISINFYSFVIFFKTIKTLGFKYNFNINHLSTF